MPSAMAMKIVRLRPMRSDIRAAGNVARPVVTPMTPVMTINEVPASDCDMPRLRVR